jgi:hypothetical protein
VRSDVFAEQYTAAWLENLNWHWGGAYRRRGCDRVALSTHSFQAPGFYARSGYRECGRTPGYPHGHDDIHLLKLLG